MFKQVVFGLTASVAIVASAFAGDEAGSLKIGDKAPVLDNVTWVKGEPVSEWQSGQVYVLDFWATWCGPCVRAIPHVNDIQAQYKDKGVNVIGMAIWPREKMVPTAEFVEKKGSEMSYRIAEDIDGAIAEKFMAAAGQNGIPTIMIVDRTGTLAWIGHPTFPEGEFDNALKEIVAGTFDLAAAKSKAEVKLQKEKQATQIMTTLREAQAAQNWSAVVSGLDELVALDPDQFGGAAIHRYLITIRELQDSSAAAKYGQNLVKTTIHDSPPLLNQLAWGIAYEFGLDKEQQDLELALAAAQRADELAGSKDPSIIDTLARVYFVKGETDKAIALQKKAVELAEEGEMKESLKQTLAEYEDAKRQM